MVVLMLAGIAFSITAGAMDDINTAADNNFASVRQTWEE
jgi:hypothetical protein